MAYTNTMFVSDNTEEEEEEKEQNDTNNLDDSGLSETALMEQFYNYLHENNIKEARRMLRTYNCFNKLNTRQLNKEYPLNGYKFTKRGDALTLYKPIEKTGKANDKEETTNEIENRLANIEDQLQDYANRHDHELKAIRSQVYNNLNSIKDISNVLNMAVNAINRMLNQK